jgi:hypothetical protein
VLIICFSCAGKQAVVISEVSAQSPIVIAPVLPAKPVMEQVVFEDKDSGLWLSYEQYRSLERNVIALREYAQKLEVILDFYEGGD